MPARIVARTPLLYAEGPDRALDRPAHVRAGSGLRLVDTSGGPRLMVAQDDASFLALVDPITMRTTSVALPAGPGGVRLYGDDRGNKKDKLDLECVEVFPDGGHTLVVALGSGSLRARERAVLAHFDRSPTEVRVVDAGRLYAALRALPLLRGCELNLEGMSRLPGSVTNPPRVRLFQRGNGKGGVDATVDIDEAALLAFLTRRGGVPALLDVRAHVLGEIGGVRLTFTDACCGPGPRGAERLLVTCAAEASPNAVDDGEVVGAALGAWDGERWQLEPILDERGERWVGKPEGLALDKSDAARAWIIVDKDDHTQPAELLTLSLS
ncbi:MAG: hypothetical protein M3Y79_00050 [Pseudomonadota bacterium]|nr:hypothetical protein [Pseudomonadota bacterium]